jgi:hypothetical protein
LLFSLPLSLHRQLGTFDGTLDPALSTARLALPEAPCDFANAKADFDWVVIWLLARTTWANATIRE